MYPLHRVGFSLFYYHCGTSLILPLRSRVGSFLWILWRSFGIVGTLRLECCPRQTASAVSRCHPCLAVLKLSEEEKQEWARKTHQKHFVAAQNSSDFWLYLELVLQFPFNPLSHMAESHLPFPQFRTDMQIQLWWYTETVPADDIQIFQCMKMITNMRMFQVYFDFTLLERFKTASVW